MSQTVSEMFGYERESDNETIIGNYDDSPSDISMANDVTVGSDSDSHSRVCYLARARAMARAD